MKKMGDFFAVNYGWIILAVVGLVMIVIAITQMKKTESKPATTKSANFAEDSVFSNPVLNNNPHYNVFYDAAVAAIEDNVNPWDYLRENWQKAKDFKGVEPALLDFITNEAHRQIPGSSSVTLSIRDYSNPNSIVMEYRDPATNEIMKTTGHDPEPALYATFTGKEGAPVTYKLLCANGLTNEIGEGKGIVTFFEDDYVIGEGDSFIGLTGSTPHQASKFAEENDLPVRFVVEGKVNCKTPNTSKVKVFSDYRFFRTGIYDVVLQPGDILRKKNGKWLYIRQTPPPSVE